MCVDLSGTGLCANAPTVAVSGGVCTSEGISNVAGGGMADSAVLDDESLQARKME